MFQRDSENWNKLNFTGAGEYGFPMLRPEKLETNAFIPFNYAKSCRDPEGKGIHFFLHDYQFHRLWDMPDRYIPMFKRFECICTPDYSLYMDMPKAMQIYNHYKKQWIGAYCQAFGITVIPTVSWSDESSYSWCFDGIPSGCTVAVSSVGCMKNKDDTERFIRGYIEMMRKLTPEKVVFHGTVPADVTGEIVTISSFQEKFVRKEGE
ncbi:hypothetical protein HNQ56_004399 [Anaerotaenia torta]|uniref:DUF4417 domain-containing protein n=1 Tax=Anaerotaenia torta TaxID=433293 RepID=UPI003D1D7A43